MDADLAAEARAWSPTTAKHVVEGQPALRSLQGAGIIEEVPLRTPLMYIYVYTHPRKSSATNT